jgi:hypothetical protein
MVFMPLIFFITALFIVHTREFREYKMLVSEPFDLTRFGANLVIFEYPDKGLFRVEVFGGNFSSKLVIRSVFKDISVLESSTHQTFSDYFYDKREPLSKAVFLKSLAEYKEKMKSWKIKNEGAFFSDEKPKAPYDFSRTILVPYKRHDSF